MRLALISEWVDPDSDIRIVDPQYNSVSPSWGPAGNLPANGPWNLDSQDEALFNECKSLAVFSLGMSLTVLDQFVGPG